MAYEALTGAHPFGATTVRGVLSEQLVGWAPSPSTLEERVERLEEQFADLLERIERLEA